MYGWGFVVKWDERATERGVNREKIAMIRTRHLSTRTFNLNVISLCVRCNGDNRSVVAMEVNE